MRTFNYLFSFIAIAWLVGCTNYDLENDEISQLPDVGSRRILTATIEQAESRLDFDGKSFTWEKGDSIAVYPAINDYGVESWCRFAALESGTSVRFAQLPEYDDVYYEIESDELLAFYPEEVIGDLVDFENDRYSFTINSWNSAQRVSKPAMAGYTNWDKINFKNIATMYKVKISSPNVTSIELRGSGISGLFFVEGLKSGVVTTSPYEYTHDNIEITGQFEEGRTYYISACPNTSQLSMYVNGELYKSLQAPMTFERNKIYNLGEIFINHRIYFTDETIYNIYPSDVNDGLVNLEDIDGATITIYDENGQKITLADGGVMQKPFCMENVYASENNFYYYEIPRELNGKRISFSVNYTDPQRRGTDRSVSFVANKDFYTYICESKIQSDQSYHPVSFSNDSYIWELQGDTSLYGGIYVRGDIPWDDLYIYVKDSNNKVLTEPNPGTKVSGAYTYVYDCPDGHFYYYLDRYLWEDITDYVYVTLSDGGSNRIEDIRMWLNSDRCVVINPDNSYYEILAPFYNWNSLDIKDDFDRYAIFVADTAGWGGINIYACDSSGNELCGSWPGVEMAQFEGEDAGYYYCFPRSIKGTTMQFTFSNPADTDDKSEESLPVTINTNVDFLLHTAPSGENHPISFNEYSVGSIYVLADDLMWDNLYIYAWDDNNNPLCGDWPGEEITYIRKYSDGHSYYEYQLYIDGATENTTVNLCFNNGHNGGENQTDNINDVYISGSHCYVISGKAAGSTSCSWKEIASPNLQWRVVWD